VDRVDMFKQFIERSPRDPFPRYGLAMEYKGRGQLQDAIAAFDELIASFPEYVASYLQAGGALAALGDRARAEETFRAGIAVAGAKGDLHAKKELEAALADL
jgi:tetratricopeptide (TPR) repeat protein